MDHTRNMAKFLALIERDGDTLGRLLSRAERLVQDRTRQRLRRRTGTDLTIAQIQVIQQVCLGATRTSDLADRMGMSKQAVGQVVDALEAKGLSERIPDATDGRAKQLAFTPAGADLAAELVDITMGIEQDIAKATALFDLRSLKRNLAAVAHAAIDEPKAR